MAPQQQAFYKDKIGGAPGYRHSQVYTLTTKENHASGETMNGNILISYIPGRVLFDSGAIALLKVICIFHPTYQTIYYLRLEVEH